MPKYNITVEFEGDNPTKITAELLEAVNTNNGKLTNLNVSQTEEEKKNNVGFQISK